MPRSSAAWSTSFSSTGNAGIGVGHRDAAAHRAGADDGGARDVAGRRVLRHVGNLGDLALGEEQMAQRAAIRSRARSRRRARVSRVEPASKSIVSAASMASTAANGARAPRAVLPSAAARRLAGGQPGRRDRRSCPSGRASCGARRRRRVPRANAIAPSSRSPSTTASTMPACARACGGDRLAVGAHLERERGAAQPRQPLRAAGAGDDAEQHFGLADLGARHGDAVVAGHRELEAAAERVAVNGGDQRLARRPRCAFRRACTASRPLDATARGS